jgi:hypothetical protein
VEPIIDEFRAGIDETTKIVFNHIFRYNSSRNRNAKSWEIGVVRV